MIKIKKDIDFLIIAGPTAVGKTKTSLELARKYNGEVINGDSVQVYRQLDIGSAKIKKEEMGGIVHHLLDIRNPDEEYTVYDFKKDCEKKIKEIRSRDKLPIIVGGTGLYLKAVAYDYEFDQTLYQDKELLNELKNYSNQKLLSICEKNCQDNNIEIHQNNRNRLINYSYKTLKNIELKQKKLRKKNTQILFLNEKRAILYDKIGLRVDSMLQKGLLKEVEHFNKEWPSQRAIGYKEAHEFLSGEITEEEMIQKIKRNTRHFAKRQITWFLNQMDVDQYIRKGDVWEKLITH